MLNSKTWCIGREMGSYVSTPVKRGFVRRLLRRSVENAETLLATLESAEDARVDRVEGGKVLIATAGNGHSASYSIPEDFTTTDALELISDIRDRYEEAKAALIEDGTANPTDQQIHDEILDKLQRVDQYAGDFSNLRVNREEEDD